MIKEDKIKKDKILKEKREKEKRRILKEKRRILKERRTEEKEIEEFYPYYDRLLDQKILRRGRLMGARVIIKKGK